jgi:phosphatidate cytidylyltransferase
MTPPPAADRPRSSDGSTGPLPPVGGRLAQASGRPAPVRDSGDTGPVPIVGSRPAPPSAPQPVVPQAVVPQPVVPQPVVPPGDDAPTSTVMEVPASSLPVTEQPPGRAGRNLPAAIAVGVGLVAVIVASLILWRPAFLGVLTAAILVAVVELTGALKAGRFRAPLVPLLVGTVAMEALAWTRGPTGLVVAFLLTVLAVVLWRLADGPEGYLRDAGAGVLVALYVPLLAGFAVLLLVRDDGAARVLAFIATVIASDVGGYAAGVKFGKHAMAPSISPKKSWEGFAGSVVACMLVATPFIVLALDGPWWGGLVFGAALAASSTIGDLGESLIKRDLGIKDMGNLLPGHGGIMDRLDSLLPSAAVAYLLLSVLAPV